MAEQGSPEESWIAEPQAPPKRSGVPAWLWFCGGGCLLAVIGLLVVGVLVFKEFKKATDPDVQWPRIAKVLPHEERPDWNLAFGWTIGMDMWVFEAAPDFAVVLMRLPGKDGDKARARMLDPAFKGSILGRGGRRDTEALDLEVQGVTLRALRFYQVQGLAKVEDDEQGGAAEEAPAIEGVGPPDVDVKEGESIVVDLTPMGDPRPLMLQVTRVSEGARISEDEVRELLSAFRIPELR